MAPRFDTSRLYPAGNYEFHFRFQSNACFASPDGSDPERAAIRTIDAEPIKEPVLAEAEEEEIAELWAGDPGNQGA